MLKTDFNSVNTFFWRIEAFWKSGYNSDHTGTIFNAKNRYRVTEVFEACSKLLSADAMLHVSICLSKKKNAMLR